MVTATNNNEKATKAVGMLTQLLSFVDGIDVNALTQDELFDLMYEAKEISSSLTAIVKAGRTIVLDTLKVENTKTLVTKNGYFELNHGSPRLSAKLFDDNLLKEGLSLDRIKALKKQSLGNPTNELDMVKNKA